MTYDRSAAQNHRSKEKNQVGRDLQKSLVQSPAHSRVTPKLDQIVQGLAHTTSEYLQVWIFHRLSRHLFHCWTTLKGKNFSEF